MDQEGILFLDIEFLGFVQAPGWSLDIDDDRVMDQSVDGRDGDDRVAEIVTKFLEIDVGGNDG